MPTPDPVEALLAKPEYAMLAERVRAFMRDYGPVNRMTDGNESSPRDVAYAITAAIDDINGTPPPLEFTVEQMIRNKWAGLIVLGAVLHLLRSVTLVHIRNHLPFNDGGLMTGGLSDRAPAIQGWISQNEGRYENYKNRAKQSANLAGMLGRAPSGVPSEYALIHTLEGC